MSDPKTQTPEISEARTRLMALADSGRVVLPYSWAHVAEMSPDRSRVPQAAMARLELMERLAGTRTFRHPAKIIALENSGTIYDGREHTIGTWLQNPEDLRRLAYKGAEDLIALVASCTEKHRQAIHRHCDGAASSDVQPVTPTVLDGALPQAVVLSLLRLALESDVDGIAELYSARFVRPSVFCDATAALGLQSGVAQQFEYLREGVQRFLLNGKVRWQAFTRNSEFQKRLSNIPRDYFVSSLAQLLAPGITVSDMNKLRGTVLATEVLCQLYQETSGEGRAPRRSDGGDVLHAFYVPYVDVFSCDKHLAEVVKRSGSSIRTVTGGPMKVALALEAMLV
jgi:hypothetical protein